MANKSENGKVRYNLTLPDEVYREVEKIAKERHTTVLSILRMFIKIGLLAVKIDGTPGATLLVREGEKETELLIL